MAALYKIPLRFVAAIESPAIATNFRSTTWILFGGLLFQLVAAVFSLRITIFITICAMLYRIIPAVLIAGGLMPNTELQYVQPGKTTVVFPGQDRSSGPDPSGHGLALLILGVRISHPLGVLAPGGKKAGDYFDSLLAELDAHPAENGWLGGTLIQERNTSPCSNAHLSIIGYFKTMDHLHAYAHGASHREAWRWWNLNAKDMPHIGVYHETFDVPAHHWEAIYLQTPALGLGKCRTEAEDGQLESMLIDARKGIWRSSTGRMGRGKGQTYDDDPYQ